MADLDARTDSFISMVLSVNSRVRTSDLSAVPEPDRAALLQAYAQAHSGSQQLHFDGELLTAGVPAPPAAYGAPMPMPDAIAAANASPAADQPVAPDAAPSGEAASSVGPAEAVAENDVAQKAARPARGLAWAYWLLPILLTWVGGLIAWAVVKRDSPKKARAMLVTGLLLTFVYGSVIFALFGTSIGAMWVASPLGSKLPTLPPTVSTAATPTPVAPAKK